MWDSDHETTPLCSAATSMRLCFAFCRKNYTLSCSSIDLSRCRALLQVMNTRFEDAVFSRHCGRMVIDCGSDKAEPAIYLVLAT